MRRALLVQKVENNPFILSLFHFFTAKIIFLYKNQHDSRVENTKLDKPKNFHIFREIPKCQKPVYLQFFN